MAGQQDLAKASRNLAAWLGLSTTHYFFFLALSNKMEEKQRAKEIPKNKKKKSHPFLGLSNTPCAPMAGSQKFLQVLGVLSSPRPPRPGPGMQQPPLPTLSPSQSPILWVGQESQPFSLKRRTAEKCAMKRCCGGQKRKFGTWSPICRGQGHPQTQLGKYGKDTADKNALKWA